MSKNIFIVFKVLCLGGGIGRHNGLKIRCPKGREGSTPFPGTILIG